MPPYKLAYRPEIDGLRALAVLPVILFHAGIPGFPGGFVGVDVFFVISGYLITSIILMEDASGSFTLAGFYERRARRILPPLFIVCLCSIPAAFFIMSPHDLLDFSKSLVAVSTFVSNFYFWAHSGYFDTETELKPLVHTWSLAVEEQFYLLFPVLLFYLLRRGRARAVVAFIIIGLVSFAFAQWGSYKATATAFYLLPARFWELLLGALIPLIAIDPRQSISKVAAERLALAGLALIVLAVLTYHNVPYPGVFTLPPAIGTLLIILFANEQTLVGRVLGSTIPRSIGLISYSAYLWHQPIFAFARLTEFYEINIPVFASLSIVSLALAVVTYVCIERPVRKRSLIGRGSIFAGSAVVTVALACFGFTGVFTRGFEDAYVSRQDGGAQRAYTLIKKYALKDIEADLVDNHDCHFWSRSVNAAFEERYLACAEKYGAGTIALGDSHGYNVYNALARANVEPFVAGLVYQGCRPVNMDEACPYAHLDEFLARHKSAVKGVVFNISGAHLLTDLTGDEENHHLFEWKTGFLINYQKVIMTANYLQTLAPLAHVVWLGPFVEARVNFRDLPELAQDGFLMNPVSLDHFKALDVAIAKELTEHPRGYDYLSFYHVLKVDRYLLLAGGCLTYSDPDHLSTCGEELLGEKLKSKLPWIATQ